MGTRTAISTLLLALLFSAHAELYSHEPAGPDPQVCATAVDTYFRPLLAGPPTACPVPVGRGGHRRHRFRPRRNQTEVSILQHPFEDPDLPSAWLPWTHRPTCGTATNYCTFSLATLPASLGSQADGPQHGLSIITTPEMAAYALHPHQFALYPHALGLFAEFVDRPPALTLHATAQRGLAAFAAQPIQAGEAVVVDRPALLAHVRRRSAADAAAIGTHDAHDGDDHGLGYETEADRARLWKAAVDGLPPSVAEQVRSLHVLPRYKEVFPEKKNKTASFSLEEQVFASNAHMVQLHGYEFKALFPNVARFNHNCKPNLVAHISEVPLTMTVWATRDINAGEELTLNYLPDLLSHDERQTTLHRRWGFSCQCPICTERSAEEHRLSDDRRQRLPALAKELRAHMEAGRVDDALDTARTARDIYALEGALRNQSTLTDYQGRPIADPFGPPELAETLGQLLAASGDDVAALPQLRAAIAELQWRSTGWPSPEQLLRMYQLKQLIHTLENDAKTQ